MDHSWKLWFSLVLLLNWILQSLSFQKINPILFLPFYNSFFYHFQVAKDIACPHGGAPEELAGGGQVAREASRHRVRQAPWSTQPPSAQLRYRPRPQPYQNKITDAYHVWNTERQLYRDAEAPKNKDLFTYMRWANICINTVTIISGNLQIYNFVTTIC